MSSLRWPYPKDPDETLDYALDVSAVVGADDSVSSVEWIVPAPLERGDTGVVGGKAVVWLSGGEAGRDYDLTARITTTGGRVYDRTVGLMVRGK